MTDIKSKSPVPEELWTEEYTDSWLARKNKMEIVLERSEASNKGYAAHGMDKLEHRGRDLIKQLKGVHPKNWTGRQLCEMEKITLEMSGYLYRLKYL